MSKARDSPVVIAASHGRISEKILEIIIRSFGSKGLLDNENLAYLLTLVLVIVTRMTVYYFLSTSAKAQSYEEQN